MIAKFHQKPILGFFPISLICIFFLILFSEKISEFLIPLPLGVRHWPIFMLGIIISLNSKNIHFKGINSRYSIYLISLLFFSFFSFLLNEGLTWLSYILSLTSTLGFLFLYLLFSIPVLSKFKINIILFSIVLMFFAAVIPGFVLSIFNFEALRWNYGFFREPGAMASSMVVAYILCEYLISSYGKRILLLNLLKYFFILCIIISGMKKIYLSLLVVLYFRYKFFGKVKLNSFKNFLLFLPILLGFILLGYGEVSGGIMDNLRYYNNVGAEGHIRLAMYITSFRIILDNPLLGTGLGSFGSIGSLVSHFDSGTLIYSISKTYSDYGLYGIADNTDDNLNDGKNTLLDTFWPHILGEFGLIGFFIYLIIYFYPVLLLSSKDNNDIMTKNLKFAVYSLVFVRALEGFVAINPELPLFSFFNNVIVPLLISNYLCVKKSSLSGIPPD